MKNSLLLLCFTYFSIGVYGQISIPNGTFETWSSNAFNNPMYYPNTSNISTFSRQNLFNVNRTTDAYHGLYAVQLSTATVPGDTAFAYFVNINPANSNPADWHGGMPYDQAPTGIRGYYKYNVATADSGTMIIAFSQGGVNIRTYYFKIGGIHNDYTLFNFTFDPPLATTPDSVEFGALSCKFSPGMTQPHGVAGSILILDSISFKGVSSQPALMNGDFELWQAKTLEIPAHWHPLNVNDQETGVYRTTDAHDGDYALELKTFLGNRNGQPAAQPGAISTGYFPDNCNGSCTELGGYPFTNQKDTLVFFYKYSPSGADNAIVNLTFKKNGSSIDVTSLLITASSVYQYKELPFDIGNTPDTVIVNIGSSDWGNSDLSFVGSDLKIDGISFKSQGIPTGINNQAIDNFNSIAVFPNPSGGRFRIKSSGFDIQKLEIYDALGKVIYSVPDFNQQKSNEIDLSKFGRGLYFVKVNNGIKTFTKKIMIQ